MVSNENVAARGFSDANSRGSGCTEHADFMISKGFTDAERHRVATLYWEAFGSKMHRVLRSHADGIAFFASAIDPSFALLARRGEVILGGAGLMTREGHFTDAHFSDIMAQYGLLSGVLRGLLLLPLTNDAGPNTLTVESLFVTDDARGLGVGTALLEAARLEAEARGKGTLRLYVVDTNTRARALYERLGFSQSGQRNRRMFRRLYGFRTMYRLERSTTDPMPQRSTLTASNYSDY